MIRGIIIFALGAVTGAVVVLAMVDRERSLRSSSTHDTPQYSLQSRGASDAVRPDDTPKPGHPVDEFPDNTETTVAVPDRSTPVADKRSAAATPVSGKSTGPEVRTGTEKAIAAVEEVAPLLDEDPASRLHDDFESEEREESWAPYMEQQISSFLASKTELANFTFPLIQCRESICEIHAVGYGPDAYVIWATAISDLPDQPWCTFTGMSSSARNVDEGADIVGLLVILHSEGG